MTDFDIVPNKYAEIEDSADVEVPTATHSIYDWIAEALGRKEDTRVNRSSAATMCPKRRQLQKRGVKGTPLTPRKIVNFIAGDVGEAVMAYFVKESLVGPGKLYAEVDFGKEAGTLKIQGRVIPHYEQPTEEAIIGGVTVTAHFDGLGQRNSDGKWELIEFKTAADYGFRSFKDEGAGDYLKQAHSNMMTHKCKALGVRSVRFFYMRKSTGHLWDRLHQWNDEIAATVEREFQAVEGSEDIPRPFKPIEETKYKKPTGRLIAPWQCGYCPYNQTCWPGIEKEWKDDQFGYKKPVYVIKQKGSE